MEVQTKYLRVGVNAQISTLDMEATMWKKSDVTKLTLRIEVERKEERC